MHVLPTTVIFTHLLFQNILAQLSWHFRLEPAKNKIALIVRFKICVNNFVIWRCSSKISIATDKIWVGHKITVIQRTMFPQKSSQKLYSLDMLTGYAHCTLVLEQTAKSSPANLRFFPLCKNTNRELHKDQLTIFPIFWLVRNETWPNKIFFGWWLCPSSVQKLFWALRRSVELWIATGLKSPRTEELHS